MGATMTKEEIIEMAEKSGFEKIPMTSDDWVCFTEELLSFAKLVAEKSTAELRADIKINQRNLLQKLTRGQK